MTSEIIVAIIVGAFSLIGTVASVYFTNRKNNTIISYKIELLEKEVQKHNILIEKSYKFETEIVAIKTELREIERRLNEL